jgi:hypothetical protein
VERSRNVARPAHPARRAGSWRACSRGAIRAWGAIAVGKVILLSILLGTVGIPIWAAGTPGSPVRAFRRMLVGVLLFDCFYLVAILYVYPRLA